MTDGVRTLDKALGNVLAEFLGHEEIAPGVRQGPLRFTRSAVAAQIGADLGIPALEEAIEELNQTVGAQNKASVRAATTAAGTLASGFENGDTVDGVVLATGDRILIKNQAAPAENGIYTVNAAGAPTRATDADAAAELLRARVYVDAGTANVGTAWIQNGEAIATLGTTAILFVKDFAEDPAIAAEVIAARGDEASLGARLEGFRNLETGEFIFQDEDGNIGFTYHPEKGFRAGGAWLRRVLDALLQVGDGDGLWYLRLDRERGLRVPHGGLRGIVGKLFSLEDAEGFSVLDIGLDGSPRFGGTARDYLTQASAVRVWAGALTDTSFRVRADLTVGSGGLARLVVTTLADTEFDTPVFVSAAAMPDFTGKGGGVFWRSLDLQVTGLTPNTSYRYALQVDGRLDPEAAHTIKTMPAEGVAAGFKFAFGGCSNVSAVLTAPALDALAGEDALFFMHIGDMTYSNIAIDDIQQPRLLNTRQYRQCSSADALNAVCPIVYVTDDHDHSSDNAHWDSVYASGDTFEEIDRNTRRAIRETTPHYPYAQQVLGETDADKIIQSHVFNCANVRFIIIDTRSQRRYEIGTPTLLGNGTNPPGSWDQKAWLKDQLLQANIDGVDRVFLVSPSPWSGPAFGGWELVPTERTEIADFIRDNPVPPLTILTGDLHFSSADDGTNCDFSTGGGLTVTQLVSSPLLQTSASSGGTHTWDGADGQMLGNKQMYCVVEVAADGEWTATFKGEPYDPVTGEATEIGVFASADI